MRKGVSTHRLVSTQFLPPSLASFFLSSSFLSLWQSHKEQRARWERTWRPEGVGGDALARFHRALQDHVHSTFLGWVSRNGDSIQQVWGRGWGGES